MRVAKVISMVTQYSGHFARSPESLDGDPEHQRIILIKDDGSQEELFKGSEFSEEKFQNEMDKRGITSYLDRE